MESTIPPEHYLWANELHTRFLAEPSLGPDLRARYMQVLDQQYELQRVLDTIDRWEDENLQSALRDEGKWGQAYLEYERWDSRDDVLDHSGEMVYLREWITARWAYLATLY